MDKQSKIAIAALCMIGVAITAWLIFWGTVGTIVIHFVHKYW